MAARAASAIRLRHRHHGRVCFWCTGAATPCCIVANQLV